MNLQMMYELRKTAEEKGQMIRETIQPLEMEPA
jgi:plasmid maintenance system antidote protein VapI